MAGGTAVTSMYLHALVGRSFYNLSSGQAVLE